MRWGTYFAVCAAVVCISLAMGVTTPLVSLRLAGWGYENFAIGVMAAIPAIGILLGAAIVGRLSAWLGTVRLMQYSMVVAAASIVMVAMWQNYWLWLGLRLFIGIGLTIVFILGESWINQLAVEHLRGRLVALYGAGYALSQLCGPLVLNLIGSETDIGFWASAILLVMGTFMLVGHGGAPEVGGHSMSGQQLWRFCKRLPTIAWAVMLFAAFETLVLTMLPVYGKQQGFPEETALLMVSVVVLGDALLQIPIGWLADRLSRERLFLACGVVLMLAGLSVPMLLHTPLIWLIWIAFGASAGGLFILALILIGERYRDDELVQANAHVAQLWGIGCLLGPLLAGAASQWISGHAMPLLMALGAAGFILLVWRRPLPPVVHDAG